MSNSVIEMIEQALKDGCAELGITIEDFLKAREDGTWPEMWRALEADRIARDEINFFEDLI